jgi:transposase
MSGDALKPFEAKFEVRDNAAVWTTREIEDAKLAEVRMLHEDGMSVSRIAEIVGVSRATAYRLVKKAEAAKTEPEDGGNERE